MHRSKYNKVRRNDKRVVTMNMAAVSAALEQDCVRYGVASR